MVEIAKRYQDELERIKDNIKKSYEYFEHNYKRFNESQYFTFISTLNDTDLDVLRALKKPQLEFNVLEAYLSRLIGEFSKQVPSFSVFSTYGSVVNTNMINLVESHLRYKEYEFRKDGCANEIYKEMIGGGFSVCKIWSEYANERSFQQDIKISKCWDPCLCGFDPLAVKPHKGDGRFCFELFPKTKGEFLIDYPNIDISKISFTRKIEGFNFSYKNEKEDILLICDYFEKKKKRVKIALLSNGQSIEKAFYDEFIEEWRRVGFIEQVPIIIDERMTELTKIVKYRFIEDQVLEYKETNYNMLPLVFFDGNSIRTRRRGAQTDMQQYTRPYTYQAKGTQRMKDVAGQNWVNYMENMIMHKIMIPKEGIPKDYEKAYKNVQLPSTLVYNQYKDNDPSQRLDRPEPIPLVPMPQEISAAFTLADQTIQAELGSYDAALGINNNQLSGIAIVEGATQSNAAAMPYIVGYMQGFTRVAEIILDLIPKYYVTPRTIPIIDREGKRHYRQIMPQQVNYGNDILGVRVEANVNFNIQKTRTLQIITSMMQSSPVFAQFMNQEGLDVLLDNLDIRGVDILKARATQFLQQLKQQQQQAAQAGQMNNPAIIRAQTEMAKMQQQERESQRNAELGAAKISVAKQDADTNRLRLMEETRQSGIKNAVAMDKTDAERSRTAADIAIKAADMTHRHTKELSEMAVKEKEK